VRISEFQNLVFIDQAGDLLRMAAGIGEEQGRAAVGDDLFKGMGHSRPPASFLDVDGCIEPLAKPGADQGMKEVQG